MNILIVDDEPLVRRSLVRALSSRNHFCVEAADGAEGLRLWIEKKPDVVILDVLMPGLSGPQVLSEASSDLKKETCVILISAYSGEHTPESAEKLGADLFLAKPFADIFQVVKLIEEQQIKKSPFKEKI